MLVLLAAAATAGCAGAGPSSAACANYRFDRAAWRVEPSFPPVEGEVHRRSEADMLVACRSLEGLRASQVRDRLGRPDGRSPRSLTYTVNGGTGSDAMDSESLRLSLVRGRVASASIG